MLFHFGLDGCVLSVVAAGYWGIFWEFLFLYCAGCFFCSQQHTIALWCCFDGGVVLFYMDLQMRLFFFFVFSAVFWCSHCVGAGGVFPSSAHQFCWNFGICSFFVPSTIMLLTVATCAAVSKVSSCLSLHVGSPHTAQNLYCLQFVVWSPSADNVDSVIVLWAHMSSPRLMHPCCWVMACFVAWRCCHTWCWIISSSLVGFAVSWYCLHHHLLVVLVVLVIFWALLLLAHSCLVVVFVRLMVSTLDGNIHWTIGLLCWSSPGGWPT